MNQSTSLHHQAARHALSNASAPAWSETSVSAKGDFVILRIGRTARKFAKPGLWSCMKDAPGFSNVIDAAVARVDSPEDVEPNPCFEIFFEALIGEPGHSIGGTMRAAILDAAEARDRPKAIAVG